MVQCCVLGCRNRTEQGLSDVTFHRFPSNAGPVEIWIQACGRYDWRPTRNYRICSKHFKNDLFIKRGEKNYLKPGALPTNDIYTSDLTSKPGGSDSTGQSKFSGKRPETLDLEMTRKHDIEIPQTPRRKKLDEKRRKKLRAQPKAEETPVEEAEAEASEAAEETTEADDAAREREARAQASIKEREKEVQRALATSLRDRDKEREHHKRDEAVQHFNALLADLVRNPELSWREAKKQLKKDHRYNLAELLTKDDKERLFGQHTSSLASKRRDKLRTILTELGVTCTAHWRHVKEQLKNEPTTPAYSSDKQMEREFRDFQRDKQSAAKTAFRQLLLESRSITHRSLAAVKENNAGLQQIHQAIKHSARYTALEHIPEERESIIMSYLEELEKKGPPPPPTATEPARRSKQ